MRFGIYRFHSNSDATAINFASFDSLNKASQGTRAVLAVIAAQSSVDQRFVKLDSKLRGIFGGRGDLSALAVAKGLLGR